MDGVKLKVYNTQRISDREALQNFIARKKEFKVLVDIIQSTRSDRPSQHQLIIGQRGMGKTTLLKRLEVELRQEPLSTRFLPLLFPEEQYNLDSLATFWLNCLDAVADIMDIQGAQDDVKELDDEIYRLMSIQDLSERTEKAYRYFCHTTFVLGKIPVLLIDNIDIVFRRLNEDELHVLRAYLTEPGAPLVIGASSNPVLETEKYDSPFYDAFQVHFLKKLSSQELLEVMRTLANGTSGDLRLEIVRHKARLKAINQLTGGNPRTAVILFNQILKGFSDTIVEDLDLILDELTPIYKARYEELSEKQQIIVNIIAMHWDPLALESIRQLTGMESGQLSPQLKRLAETGWIEKPVNERYKGGAYELCERMFNIWYLMRRSSRRQKKGVFCLSKYLEAFYENEDELKRWINKLIAGPLTTRHHAITALALAKLSSDKDLRWKLHANSRAYIKTNPDFMKQVEVADLYDNLDENLLAYREAIEQEDAQQIIISTEPLMSVEDDELYRSVILNRTIAHIYLGQYEDAIKLLKENPGIPGVVSIWITLAAEIHNSKGPQKEVENSLLQAISIENDNGEAYMYLGKYYTEIGQMDEAEKALVQATKLLKKETQELTLAKGVLFSMTHRNDEGERYLKKILHADPKNRQALFYLGYLMYYAKKDDWGLSLFEKLEKLEPDNLLVRARRHIAYEQMNQIDQSASVVAETSGSERADLCRRIALLYSLDDMDEWAYRYWVKAVEADERDVDSMISIVGYCLNEDMNEEAILYVNRILEIQPEEVNALFGGSLAYYEKEDYTKAKELILKAIEIAPAGEMFHFLGVIYEEESAYSEAKRSYVKALTYDQINKEPVLRSLGELDRDIFKDYASAETSFAQIKDTDPFPLISLYRDYMNREQDALDIFDAIQQTKDNWAECQMERVLFSLQTGRRNDAETILESMMSQVNDKSELPAHIFRFYIICLRGGNGEWLLQEYEKMGLREELAPDYHAIVAILSDNPDAYLDTIAMEIREISKSIMKILRRGL